LTGAFVEFVSVPEIAEAPEPDVAPEIPTAEGADQVYVVFAGTISVPFVGVTVNVPLLQIVVVLAAITGVGFTVTVTVNGAPVHVVAGCGAETKLKDPPQEPHEFDVTPLAVVDV
jgi:Fe-S cluster assembly scaffold protein SufB